MTPKELGEHINTTIVRRFVHCLHALFILTVLASMLSSAFISSALAVPIGERSLTISTPAAGAVSTHTFSLTLNSAVFIGSLSMEYCQESPIFDDVCTSPMGLSLSGTAISAQTGETGFSIHPTSSVNKIILTRAASIVVPGVSTYVLSGIINPSQSNTSTFVRVATHASSDATGSRIDEGGLAFSTSNPLNVQAAIPPALTLCAGLTVAVDCSVATGPAINFGDLTSATTGKASSQFAIASNDDTGYNAYIMGATMTSGVNQIPPVTTQSVSSVGSGQFGINLVANTNPAIGDSQSGPGTGVVSSNYDDSNLFKFTSGDVVASSSISTDFNRFTLTYIVNVANNQPEGIYTTTMTVLGVANF